MKTLFTVEEIYAGKEERRKRLAALPIDERVKLIDKLHEFAVEMRKWKAQRSTTQHKNPCTRDGETL